MRPLRRSPLYDRLRAKGAVFGTKLNWERANYFLPAGADAPPYTLGTPGWLPYVLDEQRACREDVVVFDQTSFAQIRPQGPRRAGGAAAAVRQRDRRADRQDGVHGDAQRTRRLRERPDDHAPGAATRSSSSPARARRRATRRGSSGTSMPREFAALVDVTSAYSVISLMGPKSEALLAHAVARRPVEGRAAVFDDRRDRRRLCARARGADELRRRPRLRDGRADRPVRDAL